MRKLTTLVCAFAVLAFAAPALAQNDDVLDENHIDDPENGQYVFWDEDEMNAFLAEYFAGLAATSDEDEGGGMLDSCTNYRPVATTVATYHVGRPSHWHVDTNITWSSYYTAYSVCYNAHNHSNVSGVYAWWRTTQANACDYCDQDDWMPEYWEVDNPNWEEMTDTRSCSYGIGTDDIYYYGREYNGLSGDDYGFGSLVLFDRVGTGTDSRVIIQDCM
jgi:hypothetical protein